MKAMVCEMCQSNELIKQDGVYVCQHCGTKYTVEEARKLMVEGSVKIDHSDELIKLYEVARRAKADHNSENAQKYYELILLSDPHSWEANFYSVYFQAMNCKIAEIENAADRLANALGSIIDLIKTNIQNPEEQRRIIDEITEKVINVSWTLHNAAYAHYHNIDPSIRGNYTQTYVRNCKAASRMLFLFGNGIVESFGDAYGYIAATCWKVEVQQEIRIMDAYAMVKPLREAHKNGIIYAAERVRKYDPSYQMPEIKTGGCYVATAVYGSYDCPQVWTLRRFRDCTLAETWYGRTFIRAYYAISPTLVKWFGSTEWFKNLWRPTLDRMVVMLNKRGVADTPYDDRVW